MSTGTIKTIAGNGYVGLGKDCVPPITVPLGDCSSVVADKAGNIYFTDLLYPRIRKVINANTVSPTIQITVDTNTICEGSPATFNAAVNNPGINPVYQWQVNGTNAGTGSNIFSSSSFVNGDIVSCMVTGDPLSTCPSSGSATSNNIVMTVTNKVAPSVSIGNLTDTICNGALTIFTATAVNAGANPIYQWQINGSNVGTNSASFATAFLANADIVTCTVSVDPAFTCVLKNNATSTGKVIEVKNLAAPSVTISASANETCKGVTLTFNAVVENAGSSPSYNWTLNTVSLNVHSNSFSSTGLSNGDELYCEIVPDAGACSTSPVNSNIITAIINPLPDVRIVPSDTVINYGNAIVMQGEVSADVVSYEWSPSDKLSNPFALITSTSALTESTTFILSVQNEKGCKATAKSVVKIFKTLYMPDAFTPNGDGVNDVFRIPPDVVFELKEFSIFDRWGNLIFITHNRSEGWDGTFHGKKQNAGVYVYFIKGSNDKGIVRLKGNVILVR